MTSSPSFTGRMSRYRRLQERREKNTKQQQQQQPLPPSQPVLVSLPGTESPPPLRQTHSSGSSSFSNSGVPSPPESPVRLAIQTIEGRARRSSPPFFHRTRPPMVSPIQPPQSPSRSWDEGDDVPAQRPRSRSVASKSDGGVQRPSSVRRFLPSSFSERSVCSDTDLIIDSPPKDDGEDLRSLASRNDRESAIELLRRTGSRNERPPLQTQGSAVEDDVSSLGGVEDQSPSLQRITQAIKNNSNRPPGLTLEEKALWDAVLTARRQARKEGRTVSPLRSRSPPSPTPSTDMESWESRLEEVQKQAVAQQRENSRSLRAIQRVLADVQAQRDRAVEELNDFKSCQSETSETSSPAIKQRHSEEKKMMQRDLQAMAARIATLEQELKQSRAVLEEPSTNRQLQRNAIQQLEKERQALLEQIDAKDQKILKLEQQSLNTVVIDESASLRKELADKSSALENAKMIIASLESASGSLASDMRAKLKVKDEELARLKSEAADRQKMLDTLATELRDLQSAENELSCTPVRLKDEEKARRSALCSRLQKNMEEIRTAAVVLEATQDAAAVTQIGEILTDSVEALYDGVDTVESSEDDAESVRSVDDMSRPAGPSGEAQRLRKELEEKNRVLKKLEDSLKEQMEESHQLRVEMEDAQRGRDEEVQSLHAEIKILRQQCHINMEVLTKKERELVVLRDSLRVEDDDVGYISDDATDAEEEEVASAVRIDATEYGPSQAEALATLLAQGGNHSFESGNGAMSNQLETLKAELREARSEREASLRELKVEKESLANAKMIISSLERANKSMMEDLRSRLQDSNTAIASLLEKSMESEKTSAKLRAELESLRARERIAIEEKKEEELSLILPSDFPAETID